MKLQKENKKIMKFINEAIFEASDLKEVKLVILLNPELINV